MFNGKDFFKIKLINLLSVLAAAAFGFTFVFESGREWSRHSVCSLFQSHQLQNPLSQMPDQFFDQWSYCHTWTPEGVSRCPLRASCAAAAHSFPLSPPKVQMSGRGISVVETQIQSRSVSAEPPSWAWRWTLEHRERDH